LFKTSPVVGYIRSARFGDPKLDEWDVQVRAYAAKRGYNLAAVFREEGVSAVAAHRPVLAQLFDDLQATRYVGLIVPTRAHLGDTNAMINRALSRISSSAWIEFID